MQAQPLLQIFLLVTCWLVRAMKLTQATSWGSKPRTLQATIGFTCHTRHWFVSGGASCQGIWKPAKVADLAKGSSQPGSSHWSTPSCTEHHCWVKVKKKETVKFQEEKKICWLTTAKQGMVVHAMLSGMWTILWWAGFGSKLSYLCPQLYDPGSKIYFQTFCKLIWGRRVTCEGASTFAPGGWLLWAFVVRAHNHHPPTHLPGTHLAQTCRAGIPRPENKKDNIHTLLGSIVSTQVKHELHTHYDKMSWLPPNPW